MALEIKREKWLLGVISRRLGYASLCIFSFIIIFLILIVNDNSNCSMVCAQRKKERQKRCALPRRMNYGDSLQWYSSTNKTCKARILPEVFYSHNEHPLLLHVFFCSSVRKSTVRWEHAKKREIKRFVCLKLPKCNLDSSNISSWPRILNPTEI